MKLFNIVMSVALLTYCAWAHAAPANTAEAAKNETQSIDKLRASAKDHMLRGKYQQAIDEYTQAIKLDPKDAQTHVNRGSSYNCIAKDKEALADYETAISLDPKLAVAYYNRASHFRRLGKLNEAIRDYSQAISLEPDYANAYFGRAWAHKLLRQRAEAAVDYRSAAKLYEKEHRTPAARDAERQAVEMEKK